jgi:predicted phage tail protein
MSTIRPDRQFYLRSWLGPLAVAVLASFTATPAAAQPGSQPTGLVGTTARNTVSLTWLAPSAPGGPVAGYQLDVGFSPGATDAVLPLGNVLSMSAVAPDGIFYVRVRAVLASGPSAPSNEVVLATGQTVPPAAPLALAAVVANTSVFLQWSHNPAGTAVTAYVLEAGSAPGQANLASLPMSPATLSFAGAVPPGTYYVRLRAANSAGLGPPSNEVVVVTQAPVCTPPGAPSGLSATTTAGAVALSWLPPVSGGTPTGYRLDVGSSSGASNLGSFPLPAQTTISTPAPAGTYFVRLVATNACGNSPPSAQISFTIAAPVPSLVGTWDGVVFNHPGSFGRPPITSFVLTVTRQPTAGIFTRAGSWADNLGCRSSNVVPYLTSSGAAVISIESLACNDGDFTMTVTSAAGAVVQGTCRGACTFRMTKR